MTLEAADTGVQCARLNLELLTQPQLAIYERASDHRPKAGHGEDTIDR